ncbi:hypothetical protein DP44_1053 [Burkholderia pseudomallei]|nr:hypothetical protein DP44_1053 [Burkholderia pseudomallei]
MRLTSRSVIENPPSIPATVRVGQSGGVLRRRSRRSSATQWRNGSERRRTARRRPAQLCTSRRARRSSSHSQTPSADDSCQYLKYNFPSPGIPSVRLAALLFFGRSIRSTLSQPNTSNIPSAISTNGINFLEILIAINPYIINDPADAMKINSAPPHQSSYPLIKYMSDMSAPIEHTIKIKNNAKIFAAFPKKAHRPREQCGYNEIVRSDGRSTANVRYVPSLNGSATTSISSPS